MTTTAPVPSNQGILKVLNEIKAILFIILFFVVLMYYNQLNIERVEKGQLTVLKEILMLTRM